jgi:hypothetical protein
MTPKTLSLTSGLILITITALFIAAPYAAAQTNSTTWSKTYGGTGSDRGYGMIKTHEGGYAIVGTTNSFGAGIINGLLVKTDVDGNLLWNQTYSGIGQAITDAIVQASDSGYAMTGYTYSLADQTGGLAAWVVKTDFSGNLEWNKTYPELGTAIGYSIIQTSDGGYAFAGVTNSIGNGGKEAWLAKTDNNGNLQWNKTYGGVGDDQMFAVIQTSDGGYALGGDTSQTPGGATQLWLVKTDSTGIMLWNQTYNIAENQFMSTLVKTSDGGYALTGTTQTATGDDYALVKTDSAGTLLWSKTYTASPLDDALSGIQTSDGGYALIGVSNSSGLPLVKTWLVKTDAAGNLQWNQTYGGNGVDVAGIVVQISDGYVLSGYTNATGAGSEDFWLVKTNSEGAIPSSPQPSATSPSPTQTGSPSTNPTEQPKTDSTTTLIAAIAVVVIVVIGVVAAFLLRKRKPTVESTYHPRRIDKTKK